MRYLSPPVRSVLSNERKMVFIAGPRQVGKTTLARFLLEEARCPQAYFNWDVESHRKRVLREPENFWRDAVARVKKPRIALDEIHKYPRWKRFLKGLYDAVSGETEILVTGSGRLDVYQRFENLVALHLLKARDSWNDLGYGDFDLHYVRDKEKREVDFLITRGRRPHFLIETKLADPAPSPALRYFHERLRPRASVQLVRQAAPDFFRSYPGRLYSMSASRFLALLP